MSIVVAYKYAANPQDATVNMQGEVDWSRAKASVSDYDSVAITLARQFADANGQEVVGISVGKSDVSSSMAKKNALSKGLDSALVVADDNTQAWSATTVAGALAELVKKIDGVEVVFTGDSSLDNGARIVSGLLGGFLGWPVFQEIISIEKSANGYLLKQQSSQGVRTLEVAGPLVIATTSDAVTVKVPSMKDILAAGKKKLETVSVDELSLVDSKLRSVGFTRPPIQERKKKIFSGENAVEDFVATLKSDGIL